MALSDVITTLSTYCLAVINNSVSGDERIFFHFLTSTASVCFYIFCVGTVSNRMRRCIFVNIGLGARIAPPLDVRRRTPGVSSDFCSLSSTKSLTSRFEQLLLCVVGLCEIILNAYFGALAFVHVFPFFSATRSPFIDYRLLGAASCLTFSVVFARVCMCFRIYASTNERDGWGLRSKEHLTRTPPQRTRTDRWRRDCPG